MITVKIVDTQGFSEEEIIRHLELLRGKVIGETGTPNVSRLMTDDASRRWLTIDESKYAGIVTDAYREEDGIYVKIKPSPALKEFIEKSSEDTLKCSVRAWDRSGQGKKIIAFDYNPFHQE